MEEVRRELIKQFGEKAEDGPNSVYAGGLWVRTSMNPNDAGRRRGSAPRGSRHASTAAAAGAIPGQSIDISTATGRRQLDRTPLGTGFPDWRKAVVLSKSGQAAHKSASPTARPALCPRSAARMPKRGVGGTAFDYLQPGMIIIVKQEGPDSYALRSDSRKSAAASSPRRCIPAAFWRCRAAST